MLKVTAPRCGKQLKRLFLLTTMKLMQFLVMENWRLTPKVFAETLNNHFSSIGKRLAKAFSGSKPIRYGAVPNSSFSLKYVTSTFVEKQLRLMKTSEAIGLDNISARLLQDAASANWQSKET